MRILIGTPVHESKDYSMAKWLESVSKFNYPFDLLMVDNSDNPEYVDKLHGYCQKYGLTNYKLVHIDTELDSILDERLAQSREMIRHEVLAKNYDAWCTLECDIIAPPDALTKLVGLIGDYWMVSHVYPSRGNPNAINAEFGIALVKRQVLEKYSFIREYGFVDSLRPNSWYGSDVWFIRRIDRSSRGKHLNAAGIITPIHHLAQ